MLRPSFYCEIRISLRKNLEYEKYVRYSNYVESRPCKEEVMAISYNRLWKLLIDKKMSMADLRKAAGIAPNTMTKLRRDEPVTLAILSKICETIDADFGDIIEYIPEEKHD